MKFLHIFPRNRQEWLGAVLFPFKAYIVIAPVMYEIFSHQSASYYRHYHPGDEAAFVMTMELLIPCSLILLFAAGALSLLGRRRASNTCAVFAGVGLVLGLCLPSLAHT
jgi:hypothetical protein